MAKKIDLDAVPERTGTRYPKPFDAPCLARRNRAVGLAAGLNLIGVNITKEDEFVLMLSGELVSVTDDGEELLRAGDCIGFPAGVQDGHHLQNRSSSDASFLVVSNRAADDSGEYPDIDLMFGALDDQSRYEDGWVYRHKNGAPYPRG
jgi:uncharacterized cupin superfamily protein